MHGAHYAVAVVDSSDFIYIRKILWENIWLEFFPEIKCNSLTQLFSCYWSIYWSIPSMVMGPERWSTAIAKDRKNGENNLRENCPFWLFQGPAKVCLILIIFLLICSCLLYFQRWLSQWVVLLCYHLVFLKYHLILLLPQTILNSFNSIWLIGCSICHGCIRR